VSIKMQPVAVKTYH